MSIIDRKRFPIEPIGDEFEPTAYNINSSGLPTYNTKRYDYCEFLRLINLLWYEGD